MTQTDAAVSLDEVLAYRNPAVVRRYLKEHGGTRAEAEELFGETLKWLYLCDRAAGEVPRPRSIARVPRELRECR